MASQEEAEIVEVAREVASECGVSTFYLKRVSWRGRGQSDECSFLGSLWVLPKTLRGKLRPEEWKHSIAASIIPYKAGGRLMWRAGMTRLVLPTILIGLALVALAVRFSGVGWTFGLLAAVQAVSTVSLLFLFAPSLKKFSLTVDRLAVEVAGRENFLRVLQKIDAMGLKDVERLKAGGLRARFKPSITERIENIQGVMPTSRT